MTKVEKRIEIKMPLVIMYEEADGSVTCRIHPKDGHDYKQYGILIWDLVRNVANAFDVDEADVREWVERERHMPTTPIEFK
jgi:hypothetical protein